MLRTLLALVAIFVLLCALDHFGLGQTAEEQAGLIPLASGGWGR